MHPEAAEAPCPECGEVGHDVLKDTPANTTVRCRECGAVRALTPRQPRSHVVPLIVSDGERSLQDRIEVLTHDVVAVGAEFDHEGHRLLVTAIETQDGRHAEEAEAGQVKLLHAKRFDQVTLRLSCNEGAVTRSYRLMVDPDQPVHIGEVLDVDGRRLVVKTLKSDQNRTLHKGFLLARSISRAFCEPAPARARPGERIATRPRGRAASAAKSPRRRGAPTGRRGPRQGRPGTFK